MRMKVYGKGLEMQAISLRHVSWAAYVKTVFSFDDLA